MKTLFRKADIDRLEPLVLDWKRSHPTCVLIPTCGTPEVTSKTIQTLFQLHARPTFDVVIIDNGGQDYLAIRSHISGFPNASVQVVAVAENLGSAGSHYLGMNLALRRGYEVLILSDNDAEMETPEGIQLLLEGLKTGDVILPANKSRGKNPRHLPFEATFHYLTLKAATALRLGLPDPFFFLNGDDVEYVMRAEKAGFGMQEIQQVSIRHWLIKPVLLTNQTRYFTVRNYLYLAFHCQMKWMYRFRFLIFVPCYLVMEGIHALQMRDLSVFSACLSGMKDFIQKNLRLDIKTAHFKYAWESPEKRKMTQPVDFQPLVNRIFLKDSYQVPGLDGGVEVFGRTVTGE